MVDMLTDAVKLTDVEYAKKIGESCGNEHHDVRTVSFSRCIDVSFN